MRTSSVVWLAALSAASALAAPTLTLTLQTVSTVTENGTAKEVLAPASKVHPGDVLLQTAKPVTDKAMKTASITVPVPKNTSYLPNSASSAAGLTPVFSADGKSFSAKPTRTVTVTEKGVAVQKVVDVPQNEYRSVRWVLTDFRPGAQPTLSFKVVVN